MIPQAPSSTLGSNRGLHTNPSPASTLLSSIHSTGASNQVYLNRGFTDDNDYPYNMSLGPSYTSHSWNVSDIEFQNPTTEPITYTDLAGDPGRPGVSRSISSVPEPNIDDIAVPITPRDLNSPVHLTGHSVPVQPKMPSVHASGLNHSSQVSSV